MVFYFVNGYVMVKGKKFFYDGDLLYWSKRNFKFYFGEIEKVLK